MSLARERNSEDESLDLVIGSAFSKMALGLNTCIPARVTSFDAQSRTLNAIPIPKRKFQDEFVSMPELVGVPIVYPSSSGYELTFPISKGDEVLVVFSQRQIEALLRLDEVETKTHDLSDGIAIPAFKINAPVNNGLFLGGSGSEISQIEGEISLKSTGLSVMSNGVELLDVLISICNKLSNENELNQDYTAELSQIQTMK